MAGRRDQCYNSTMNKSAQDNAPPQNPRFKLDLDGRRVEMHAADLYNPQEQAHCMPGLADIDAAALAFYRENGYLPAGSQKSEDARLEHFGGEGKGAEC